MNPNKARKSHAALSLLAAPLLLVPAITGALWTVQKHWLGGEKPAKWLMKWHQGDGWLGWASSAEQRFRVADGPLPSLPLTKQFRYPIMWGMLLVGLAHFGFGVALLADPRSKAVAKQRSRPRRAHHILAWCAFLPLSLTIVTGAAYRLLRMHAFPKRGAWGVKWILELHQGFVGALLPVYPLAMAGVVLLLVCTALAMHPLAVALRQRCAAARRRRAKRSGRTLDAPPQRRR